VKGSDNVDRRPASTGRFAVLLTVGLVAQGNLFPAFAASRSVTNVAVAQGAPATRPSLGLNVGALNYYGAQFPLIDLFPSGKGWLTQCMPGRDQRCSGFAAGASSFDTREQNRLDLDAQGWPRRLPEADDVTVHYRSLAVLLLASQPRPAGRYVVLHDGQGTLQVEGPSVTVTSSRPGRLEFTLSTEPKNVLLRLMATKVADPVRHIRVLMPGGSCADSRYAVNAADCAQGTVGYVSNESLHARGERWHPKFLEDMRHFRALRFMDFASTNNSEVSAWVRRPLPTDAFWNSPRGAPFELMFDLAAKTRADPWINVPMRADDAYLRHFGELVATHLPPGATLYVEHGNEPWNLAFKNSRWVRAQADALWGDDRSPYERQLNWYAMRAVQACRLVKQGAGQRASDIVCTVNGQAVNAWALKQVLECPMARVSLGTACSKGVDALAIAPYFGYSIADLRWRNAVSGWYDAPDGGLAKLFEQLRGLNDRDGVVNPPLMGRTDPRHAGSALDQARTAMKGAARVAAAAGLPLLAYEAGQHLTAAAKDDDAAWQALYIRANADPRMGRAYRENLSDWRAAGGQLLMLYSYATPPSRYGAFGLKSYQFDDDAVKWQTAVDVSEHTACWWTGCAGPSRAAASATTAPD